MVVKPQSVFSAQPVGGPTSVRLQDDVMVVQPLSVIPAHRGGCLISISDPGTAWWWSSLNKLPQYNLVEIQSQSVILAKRGGGLATISDPSIMWLWFSLSQ